jgi:hypothetical protein
MKKRAFPFGSVLHVKQFTDRRDPVYDKYREYFFDNFNLAVVADGVRWKPMEKSKVSAIGARMIRIGLMSGRHSI